MDNSVVVVGAGPTGLTAAAELARRGVAVRVLDAAPAPSRGSRGKGMQPRTLEALDPLGVTDRLISLGRFELPIRHHEPDGGHSDNVLNPGPVSRPDAPWARSMIIPQWRTEQVLRERLAELGVTVEQDARVAGLTQDASGVVLTLHDGRTVTASYVVGADGGSSVVRHELGVSFLGETDEEIRMLLADVEVDGLDRDHWHMWDDEPGLKMLAICPLPATTTWQLQAGHSDPARIASEEEIRGIVDGLAPRIRLRRVDWSSSWRLNVRMVDHYRSGRVFLAGDAAHVHSPAGGQGMNTGIQDAVNLAWKLAAVLGGAEEALLDTYEAERLPVAAHVLGLSNRLLVTPFTRRGLQGQDTLQLGVTYRGGPLDGGVTDGPGPRAGDRAPEAALDAGSSVFLRRRETEWLLLTFGGARADLDGVTTIDADPAASTYEAADGELVLVRPDGVVGWRGTDVDDLRTWAAGVGLAQRAPIG